MNRIAGALLLAAASILSVRAEAGSGGALFDAVRNDDSAAVATLVSQGVDVNARRGRRDGAGLGGDAVQHRDCHAAAECGRQAQPDE
jgi:hypothetical protein